MDAGEGGEDGKKCILVGGGGELFFFLGKTLEGEHFLMKKSIEMGRKGLFFCGGYITMWLKVAQSGFLWWKTTAKV